MTDESKDYYGEDLTDEQVAEINSYADPGEEEEDA